MALVKFYTLKSWKLEQDLKNDKAFSRNLRADLQYRKYRQTIQSKLPPDFQRFLTLAYLEDGEVLKIEIETALRIGSLWCTALDVASKGTEGHYLRLEYQGLQKFSSTSPVQDSFGGDGYGDIGYTEIEILAEGVFEHRFLFSTGIEMAFDFTDFKLIRLPLSDLKKSRYGKWRKLL